MRTMSETSPVPQDTPTTISMSNMFCVMLSPMPRSYGDRKSDPGAVIKLDAPRAGHRHSIKLFFGPPRKRQGREVSIL